MLQYLLQQNRFRTGEGDTIKKMENKERDMRGMPLITVLYLAILIESLILIRGVNDSRL